MIFSSESPESSSISSEFTISGVARYGEVWTSDVEEALQEATKKYPPFGRRKRKCSEDGQMYGRNELISKYILRKTGHFRSTRQISSHLQACSKRLNSTAAMENDDDGVLENEAEQEVAPVVLLPKELKSTTKRVSSSRKNDLDAQKTFAHRTKLNIVTHNTYIKQNDSIKSPNQSFSSYPNCQGTMIGTCQLRLATFSLIAIGYTDPSSSCMPKLKIAETSEKCNQGNRLCINGFGICDYYPILAKIKDIFNKNTQIPTYYCRLDLNFQLCVCNVQQYELMICLIGDATCSSIQCSTQVFYKDQEIFAENGTDSGCVKSDSSMSFGFVQLKSFAFLTHFLNEIKRSSISKSFQDSLNDIHCLTILIDFVSKRELLRICWDLRYFPDNYNKDHCSSVWRII